MTRALPRASLHSAPLVRFLAERALLEPVPAPDHVGERLGQWLDFRQAIPLHALLQAGQLGGLQGLARVQPLPKAGAAEHILRHVAALQPGPAKLLTHVQAHY
jgi:hypothetical protein